MYHYPALFLSPKAHIFLRQNKTKLDQYSMTIILLFYVTKGNTDKMAHIKYIVTLIRNRNLDENFSDIQNTFRMYPRVWYVTPRKYLSKYQLVANTPDAISTCSDTNSFETIMKLFGVYTKNMSSAS